MFDYSLQCISGYKPENVQVKQHVSSFNISWQPPDVIPSKIVSYAIRYKLASDAAYTAVTLDPMMSYFLLPKYPHFGRLYEIEMYANYWSGRGEPIGPIQTRAGMRLLYYGTIKMT